MVAVAPLPFAAGSPPGSEDRYVLIRGADWKTYVLVNDAIDAKHVKVSFYRRDLEIMTKGSTHEIAKKLLARLLEMWAIECDVPIHGAGETTFRSDLEDAGVEPDECYTVGHPLERFPDLAIEVVVTRGAMNKLPIYRTLGVREVWIWEEGMLTVHVLGRSGYRVAKKSTLLPIDLGLLARHANMADQHAAVKSFRDALRRRRTSKRTRRKR